VTNIRPQRDLPVKLSLCLALRRRCLSLSRGALELLADARVGSIRSNNEHAGCDAQTLSDRPPAVLCSTVRTVMRRIVPARGGRKPRSSRSNRQN